MKNTAFWNISPCSPLKVNPMQNHENANDRNIGEGEARRRINFNFI
jgi:hypothetical protein